MDVWGKDVLGRGTNWSTDSGVGTFLICQRSSKGTSVVGRKGVSGRGEWKGPDHLSLGGVGRA